MKTKRNLKWVQINTARLHQSPLSVTQGGVNILLLRERESRRPGRSREVFAGGRKREQRGLLAGGVAQTQRGKRSGDWRTVRGKKRVSLGVLSGSAKHAKKKKKWGRKRKRREQQWSEERRRVGTGYRATREENVLTKSSQRKRELGYGDPQRWQRPPGREVTVEKGSRRRRKAQGEGCRERVMDAAASRERRRPRSVYTGAGRGRKGKVGQRKLKSTKG